MKAAEVILLVLIILTRSSARTTWKVPTEQGALSDTKRGAATPGSWPGSEASSSELLKMFAREDLGGGEGGGGGAKEDIDVPHARRHPMLPHLLQEEEEEEDSPSATLQLSPDEMDLIKQRVLDALGLVDIPQRNLSNITKEEFDEAYREYQTAVEEEENRYEEQLLSEESQEGDEESLEDDSSEEEESSYRFYSVKTPRRITDRERRSTDSGKEIVHFHVFIPSVTINNSSSIVGATSRFWKRGNQRHNASTLIPVTFYRLDNIPRRKGADLAPILMDTVNVSVGRNEWIEVDMTEAVKLWLKNSKQDTGVLIHCPDCERFDVKFVTGGTGKGVVSPGSKIPRLDVNTQILGLKRVKRSRKLHRFSKKGKKWADCQDATHSRGRKSKRCCRRSMKVKFSELDQFNFIISPQEFDAYYCSGRCPARYNPANEHALLQSFLNLRNKREIPGPCCAPTELKGLPILHISEDGKLKTTFWSDVIVTKCECA